MFWPFRCQLRERDEEIRELKERVIELEQLVRKGAHRIDVDRRQRVKENAGNGASAVKVKIGYVLLMAIGCWSCFVFRLFFVPALRLCDLGQHFQHLLLCVQYLCL